MIKFNTNDEGNTTTMATDGTLKELCAEAILFIKVLYDGIKEKNEEAGEDFRKVITGAINENLPFMDEEQIDKEIEKLKKSEREKIIDEFINALKEALE